MKTTLAALLAFLSAALVSPAQTITITGPIGTPPDELMIVQWQQLAGFAAELQYSEDMEHWRTLGHYFGFPQADEDHTNLIPVWLGNAFFRTVQNPVPIQAPQGVGVFAMWPEDAFAAAP